MFKFFYPYNFTKELILLNQNLAHLERRQRIAQLTMLQQSRIERYDKLSAQELINKLKEIQDPKKYDFNAENFSGSREEYDRLENGIQQFKNMLFAYSYRIDADKKQEIEFGDWLKATEKKLERIEQVYAHKTAEQELKKMEGSLREQYQKLSSLSASGKTLKQYEIKNLRTFFDSYKKQLNLYKQKFGQEYADNGLAAMVENWLIEQEKNLPVVTKKQQQPALDFEKFKAEIQKRGQKT